MSQVQTTQLPASQIAAQFNRIAPTYDHLHFLARAAVRLAELAPISLGARVLDVATGTGVVALTAAPKVGANGKVVGVDISPGMLALARQKASAAGLHNLEFREVNAERLDFPSDSFDVVLCASALFVMPDIPAVLRECHRVLVPGGRIGFSIFGPNFLEPLRGMWGKRLKQYGLGGGAPPTQRVETREECEELLRRAGFTPVEVKIEQLGYYESPAERWAEIQSGMEGMALTQLPPEKRAEIEREHVEELNSLNTPQGLWIDVPTLLAFGAKG